MRQQNTGTLIQEFLLDLAANLLEGRRGLRLDSQQLKYGNALRCGSYVRRSFVFGCEDCIHKLLRRSKSRQHVFARNEVGRNQRHAGGCSGCVEALSASLLQQVFGFFLRDLLAFLMLDNRLDRIFHFVERLHVSFLLIVDADYVEAITALHKIADLSLGKRKRGLLKLGDGLAFADPSERSALLGAAGIFGIFLGEFLEIGSALHLLEQILSAALRFGDALIVNLAVRTRKRRLDQDVADLDLLGYAVLIPMLIVVDSQIIGCDLNAGFGFSSLDKCVFDLALLGNRVGVALLMAIVIGRQFHVGGMQPLFDVFLLQDGVVELDLGVLLDELVVNLCFTNACAAGNQGLQFGQENFFADGVFKLLWREVVLLQHVLVFGLPNEVAAGEEGRGIAAVLQFVPDLFWADTQAHAIGLAEEGLARDQLVRRRLDRILDDERHDLRRHLAVALGLLLGHIASGQTDLIGGHVGAVYLGNDALTGRASQFGTESAGNEGDHHGGANYDEDAPQDKLLERPLFLQKSNHCLITPEE